MTNVNDFFSIELIGSAYGYDVKNGSVRLVTYNDTITIGNKSNDSRILTDYPEDCAAISFNAKTLKKNVSSGIYQIWPKDGNFYAFFVIYSTFTCPLK